MRTTRWLAFECFAVFVALPAWLAWARPGGFIYLLLLLLAIAACIALYREHRYRLRDDLNFAALTAPVLRAMLLRFAVCALALLVFAALMIPERLFSLPLERPALWAKVMVFYPVVSVFTQEIIFRSFFFRRYARLFSPRGMMIANALAFGWAHIVLTNWVAVFLCIIGGYIFADTYRKTHSLAAVWLEHALYGNWIFTLGMGVYFYYGLR